MSLPGQSCAGGQKLLPQDVPELGVPGRAVKGLLLGDQWLFSRGTIVYPRYE